MYLSTEIVEPRKSAASPAHIAAAEGGRSLGACRTDGLSLWLPIYVDTNLNYFNQDHPRLPIWIKTVIVTADLRAARQDRRVLQSRAATVWW
jgi:hypothetical protein